jgi:hypothetical protein
MSQANVRSVDAIRDFKIALINFAEEAQIALGSVEMEIRQARNWLVRDQLTFWQAQVKRYNERVSTTRADLHRRRLSQSNSDAISDTDQKEALREAQRKLREAEDKVVVIKRWIPLLDHAIAEYNSHSQPLGDRLSGSFVATLNLLDRMLDAIDSYLATAPPPMVAVAPPRRAASESESESESEKRELSHEHGSGPTESRVEVPAGAVGRDEGTLERPGGEGLREEPLDPHGVASEQRHPGDG